MQAESSAVPAESVSWTFPPEQLETALQTIIQLYMPARPPQYFENTANGTEEGAPRPAAPSPPKPISRVMCGERLFEAIPREKAIEFFRATLEYVPQFVGSDGRPWQMKNGLGVDHILIQVPDVSLFVSIRAGFLVVPVLGDELQREQGRQEEEGQPAEASGRRGSGYRDVRNVGGHECGCRYRPEHHGNGARSCCF